MSRKKIDALMRAVYSSAEEKAKHEIEEIKAASDSALKEYEAELRQSLRASERRIAAREEAKAAETAARAENDLRSSLYRRRSDITDEVFREVRKNIDKFKSTPDYLKMLKDDAVAAAERMSGSDGAVIRIGRADEAYAEEISRACKIPVEISDDIKIGGISGVCAEIECDCTLDSRMKDAEADFAENSGLSVV